MTPVATLLAALLLATPTPTPIDGPADRPAPSSRQLASSVTTFHLDGVTTFRLGGVTKQAGTSRRHGRTTLTVGSDVLFAFDSARIDPAAEPALRGWLAKIPATARVDVAGYTDSVGSPSYNLRLSRRRAGAVAALVRELEPGARLTATGRGEADPVRPNTVSGKDNPAGRARNRRVELVWRS